MRSFSSAVVVLLGLSTACGDAGETSSSSRDGSRAIAPPKLADRDPSDANDLGPSAATDSAASGSSAGAASDGAASGSNAVPPSSPAPIAAAREYVIGGSNYVMFDVGRYLAEGTEAAWYAAGELRPVIGAFHTNPARVREQLATMYANGQRRIALMLWYLPFWAGAPADGIYGHTLDSSGAALRPQHAQNLRDVLALIRDTGFEGVNFRFAQQGDADPGGWPAWNEARYQENWNFIVNTKSLVDSVLVGSGVELVYDLGAELGGLEHGQCLAYTRRLWSDYTYVFGKDDTYGFSFALAPGRVARAIANYDATGARPLAYAFDVYDNLTELLSAAHDELSRAGEADKPITIQETFYNDAIANGEIRRAAESLGFTLRTLMQWPMARGAATPHFSMHYPPLYDAFLATDLTPPPPPVVPSLENAGSGCDDFFCLWILADQVSSDVCIDVRTVSGADVIDRYCGEKLHIEPGTPTLITLRLSDFLHGTFESEGLRIWVVNPSMRTWSEPRFVRRFE